MLMTDRGGEKQQRRSRRQAASRLLKLCPQANARGEQPTSACFPLYVHSLCFSSVTRQYTCNNREEESCPSTPQSVQETHSSAFDRTRWCCLGEGGKICWANRDPQRRPQLGNYSRETDPTVMSLVYGLIQVICIFYSYKKCKTNTLLLLTSPSASTP